MDEHRFEKSMPYNSIKGCKSGYHKRSEYTTSAGTFVPARCVKSAYDHSTSRKMKAPGNHMTRKRNQIHCPKGYIARAPYARRYKTSVRERGYTVKKASGTTYRVYPKSSTLYVPASCIKDPGEPGKGPPDGKGIGPLKEGDMTRFGYSTKKSTEARHEALRRAVAKLGALNTYRKLDAVAKLSVRIAPDASRIFSEDRDWVSKTFGPLKAL